MYIEIINELKSFLTSIFIDSTIINADMFQGVFIKKLSNQNIIKAKRTIKAGKTISSINQTHIDITSKKGKLFFFESPSNTTTSIQDIDIDVFANNLNYLKKIDSSLSTIVNNKTVFSRSTSDITDLTGNNTVYHSSAFKKHGHTGDQVQLNIPDQEEPFTRLHKHAYLYDALVLLRYNYFHYLAIIIPYEHCNNIYNLTKTSEKKNVNVTILNPSYDSDVAELLQKDHITPDVNNENNELEILINTLLNNYMAGTDIEKIMKSRVSQGAFRRMLMLSFHHKCCLCDITTTPVLRASHIKSWSISSREERIDSNNGLLLCANHDALFDRHLISFNPDSGKICISSSIDEEQLNALNISDSLVLSIKSEMHDYMAFHNNVFTTKENS